MAAPLKIIIFDGSLRATTFINRLAKGLAVNHRVYIVGFEKSIVDKVPGVIYKSLGSSESLLHLLSTSFLISFKTLFQGNLGQFFKVLAALFFLRKKELKQINFSNTVSAISPDILHVQWPSLLPWVEKLLEQKKTKIILSQRGYQNNVRPFVEPTNFKYLQKKYPQLDGFHSVSKGMSRVGDEIYTSASKIDAVVYSGFELNALPFSENYQKNAELNLISVGRPHWIKGYSDALRACKMMKEAGMAFNYCIVGAKGNEELEYLAHDLGLQKEVELLPKVSQQEVYELMNRADVLLFSSIKEGLPNVVVEAMAIGLPVISTNCGGVEELLSDNCGAIVPVRDATAMCEALISFSEMPETAIIAQRKKARQKVEEQHPVNSMVANMEALYLKCLQSNRD